MKIPPNVDCVDLPEPVDIATVQLVIFSDGSPHENPHSYGMRAQLVPMSHIFACREQAKAKKKAIGFGKPTQFAVAAEGLAAPRLYFPCRTDKQYFARVRFNPPSKEI